MCALLPPPFLFSCRGKYTICFFSSIGRAIAFICLRNLSRKSIYLNETKTKGLITELQCELFFSSLGYNVLTPLCEDCKYDFIVDIDGNLCRIQAKTCHLSSQKNGIEFFTKAIRTNTKNVLSHGYTATDIDYFATFYNGQCYLVNVNECSVGGKKLSFSDSKNSNHVNLLDDYEATKQIEKIKQFGEATNSRVVPKIYQYDLKGKLLATYPSINVAARDGLGDASKHGHLSKVIKSNTHIAYGYLWERK